MKPRFSSHPASIRATSKGSASREASAAVPSGTARTFRPRRSSILAATARVLSEPLIKRTLPSYRTRLHGQREADRRPDAEGAHHGRGASAHEADQPAADGDAERAADRDFLA